MKAMSPGELGLLLTWKRLFREIVEKGLNRVIILEDDCCFAKDFTPALKRLVATDAARVKMQSYDIVRIGSNMWHWHDVRVHKAGYFLTPKNRNSVGAFGLCLGKRVCEAINSVFQGLDDAEQLHQMSQPVDMLLMALTIERAWKDMTLFPNLIVCDVSDSDLRHARNQSLFSEQRRWDMRRYDLCGHGELLKKFHLDPRRFDGQVQKFLNREERNVVECGTTPIKFVFIIASHNNADWVQNNILSVCHQEYEHWRAVYVNDCSTDETLARAKAIVSRLGAQNRFLFIDVPQRRYPAHSRYIAYTHETCEPDEVAVFLDGDDWLINGQVLHTLARLYQEHNLQVSYGGHVKFHGPNRELAAAGCRSGYSEKECNERSFRESTVWRASHLKTARISLLQSATRDTHFKIDGEWIPYCTDVALMMVLLEAADIERHMFVSTPLMVYNQMSSVQRPTSYYHLQKNGDLKAKYRAILSKLAPGLSRSGIFEQSTIDTQQGN